MNICMCGAQSGGYPHHKYCPYPLYNATEEQAIAWHDVFMSNAEYDRELIGPLAPGIRYGEQRDWFELENDPNDKDPAQGRML